MARYIRRTSIVDAFQWTGDHDQTEDPDWIVEAIKAGDVYFFKACTPEVRLVIRNPFGTIDAQRGDYIIRDKDGFIYKASPDTFEREYLLAAA